MIKPEMVPESAWQQASGLWFNGATWPQIIAAALNAWPGMDTIMLPRMMQPGHFVPQDYIRLPLTEKQDDKA